jgi:signal recognition particle receptor subunit beta
MDANVESVENLVINLKSQGYELNAIPYVLQVNKRDLPNVATVNEMSRLLVRKNPPEPTFEAVAARGVGVFETLKGVAKLVLSELTKAG